MTASAIPLTKGQADNGGEGIRFVGQTIYDSLIAWDLTHADKPAELIPGLAVSWTVDPVDRDNPHRARSAFQQGQATGRSTG